MCDHQRDLGTGPTSKGVSVFSLPLDKALYNAQRLLQGRSSNW